jgi:hypothetical protein
MAHLGRLRFGASPVSAAAEGFLSDHANGYVLVGRDIEP